MNAERKDTCGNRIRVALNIRGMKQSELCQITKMPKSALSQYISGYYEPKQDRIYLIAKALDVSEAWLMGYDVPMDRQKSLPTAKQEELTNGERMMLELFNQIPKEQQPMVIEMIRVALNMKK